MKKINSTVSLTAITEFYGTIFPGYMYMPINFYWLQKKVKTVLPPEMTSVGVTASVLTSWVCWYQILVLTHMFQSLSRLVVVYWNCTTFGSTPEENTCFSDCNIQAHMWTCLIISFTSRSTVYTTSSVKIKIQNHSHSFLLIFIVNFAHLLRTTSSWTHLYIFI